MKLITEVTEDIQVIKETIEEGGKKSYFIEGIFLQGDIKNRNGRKYPMDILEKEVNRYTENYIKKSRAFGELGHPSGPTINLERVSHMIKDIRRDGSNFVGKAKIMETPYGDIVKNLLSEGARIGVSSRGMGTLKENNGIMEVQNDFYLATAADIVADPSAPDAFVNGIMEGVEWAWDNGILRSHIETTVVEQAAEEAKKSPLAGFVNLASDMALPLGGLVVVLLIIGGVFAFKQYLPEVKTIYSGGQEKDEYNLPVSEEDSKIANELIGSSGGKWAFNNEEE